jgi:ribosomal protein S18 acetylase RimI-like enzyme
VLTTRERREADIAACIAIAEAVHQADDYPRHLPTDLNGFLASPSALAAFVAEVDGVLVGHVAVHRRTADQAMELAATSLGIGVGDLGVVARLLVAPAARGHGAGKALLSAAATEIRRRRQWPILDVDVDARPAIALYKKEGWRCVGEFRHHFRSGGHLDELVFVAPAAPGAGGESR